MTQPKRRPGRPRIHPPAPIGPSGFRVNIARAPVHVVASWVSSVLDQVPEGDREAVLKIAEESRRGWSVGVLRDRWLRELATATAWKVSNPS